MIVFQIIDFLFILLLFFVCILFLILLDKNRKNQNYPKPNRIEHPTYAILIPARDESRVIEGLLKSIKKQTFPISMEDVYIIIERKEDPTLRIAKKYQANVVIRKNLHLKRKGYALDEGVKYILEKKKKYDAYFIFDADNILDPTYFQNMTDTFQKGYDIGVGYRNTKNGNRNLVSACSTLTFSMINTLGNLSKNEDTRNVTISGTGFYIAGSFIEKWQGYPFHSLTEDYELTLYSSLHEMTSFYNEKAIFYDEQPTSFKVSITQRTRWVKGFFEARREYTQKLYDASKRNGKNCGSQFSNWLGVLPYLLLAIGFALELGTKLLGAIFLYFQNPDLSYTLLKICLGYLVVCYCILWIVTLIIIKKENKKIDLDTKSKIKALFFNPFFLASYVHCFIKSLKVKELEWKKIDHGAS